MKSNTLTYLLSTFFGYLAIIMYNYFVIIYAYNLTSNEFFGATLFLLMNVPYILFGFISSKYTEFTSKKKIIFYAQFCYLILISALGGMIYYDLFYTKLKTILLLISLLLGFAFAFLPASRLAIIKDLNDSKTIGRISLYINLLYITAFGIGPLLVGILKNYLGDFQILSSISLIFLISNLFLLKVNSISKFEVLKEEYSIGYYWKELSLYLNSNKRILFLLLLIPYTTLLLGPFQVLIPAYAEAVFHLSEIYKPIYFIIMSIGLAFGGFLAILLRNMNFKVVVFGSSIVAGLSLSILMQFENLIISIISVLIASTCSSYATNLIVLLIQNYLNDKFRLRILNIYSILQLGSAAFIGFLTSKISTNFNPKTTFQSLGIMLIIFSILILFSLSYRKINLNTKYTISG